MNVEERGVFNYLKAICNIKFNRCTIEAVEVKTILNLIEKQQTEIDRLYKMMSVKDEKILELRHFKKKVNDIIEDAYYTAEPTYWNIKNLLASGQESDQEGGQEDE